jgi:L-fucono-1,5-lactonase
VTTPGTLPAAGAAGGAPVIDAHQHFWDVSAHDQPWLRSDPGQAPLLRNFTPADLAPLAAASGVTATVVVQTVAEPWETPELLALADRPGLVAGVVGWADLTAPDVADALAALRELPGGDRLAGVRHPVLVEPDPDFGSDWPPCTLDASYAQVCAAARSLTAGLSDSEQEAIFSRTARRAYRLR